MNAASPRGTPTAVRASKQVVPDDTACSYVDSIRFGPGRRREAVTMIMGVVVGLTFMFGFGNVLNSPSGHSAPGARRVVGC
ncbi:hypothetical protein [Amycolatopsis pithecellobii]|uniref:hypothetical protein n=1 Tax=Amycolatopsis pithecellobii TaxID=664692 RepID=UPI00140AC619|nr:hypothetical protein [Amycolatopsis pithecellobii]